MPGVGKLRLARSFYAARGHLQKYKPCSLVLTVKMVWATKRPANEPLPIYEIPFNFHFSVKCGLMFIEEWALGGMGFVFKMSFRFSYRYWARGSGPWAVRVAKNRAISTIISTTLLCSYLVDY